MKSARYSRVWGAALSGILTCLSIGAADTAANSITVVSSHQIGKSKADLSVKGGLSLYVKVNGETILFDTGDKDGSLLENLEELGLDTAQIDAVVFSHGQLDHINGELLDELSATEANPKIYVPAAVVNEVLRLHPSANLFAVSKPTRVLTDAWVVGPIQLDADDASVVGQALVLDQSDGLVVIVGCSAPDVASVVQKIKEIFGFPRITLLAGGFHLQATSKKEIREISLSLQQKGVQNLALSECTGGAAMKIFRQEWGNHVVSLDFGKPVGF
jgi:7,8-dihydropterin-6-yl-methyl-4-(beta-D-ribofuranosyl)aminobenzene 5'-phosphate synthase